MAQEDEKKRSKRRRAVESDLSDNLFLYTGAVPMDVVYVRFDPSVGEVAEKAFYKCMR